MAELRYRPATREDVPTIVAMLADDILGATRETTADELPELYYDAFNEIDADPNQYLCVVEDGREIVGTLQLTFIPGLARSGAKRGQIEAVRISKERRSEGLGEAMFNWAIEESRSRGCSIVQLTADIARTDAHRFYEKMGFRASHVGYKIIF